MDLRETVRDTYIDLDQLICRCGLSETQHRVISLLMQGASLTDIAELDGCTVGTVNIHLRRAIEKIVRENNENWGRVYGKKDSEESDGSVS
jgi:DNA-directed RNA polymerase specialized sigma24 family protein